MSTEVEVFCPRCRVTLAVVSYADGVPVGTERAWCSRCRCMVEVSEGVTVVMPGVSSVTAVAGRTVRIEVEG